MREIIYNLKITNLIIYHGKSEMLRKNCRSLRNKKKKKDKKMIAGRLKKQMFEMSIKGCVIQNYLIYRYSTVKRNKYKFYSNLS